MNTKKKRCKSCQELKLTNEFGRYKSGSIHPNCKACILKYQKKRAKAKADQCSFSAIDLSNVIFTNITICRSTKAHKVSATMIAGKHLFKYEAEFDSKAKADSHIGKLHSNGPKMAEEAVKNGLKPVIGYQEKFHLSRSAVR